MNQQVTEYINSATTEQKAIMELIRELIYKNVPTVSESFKWSRPIFGTTKDFAYLQANKQHVNFGFYKHFDQLPDPKGILQGTGSTMRHIKLKSVADVDAELLSEWLKILTQD